ncbi:MAG TPA: hypothetical protein VFB78_12575 [Acidimicrobiales bacterium]|nr:hypothetical protein [Acidimicrobiales bacterium]
MRRAGVLLGLITAALLVLGGAAAWAVSDGQYDYHRHHCSGAADDSEDPGRVEEGCQSITINVADGAGNEGFVGLQQTADGQAPDPSAPVYGVPATFDPASGVHVYFGADDNLDDGEHDSSPLIANGPSDGGAIVANADPAALDAWVAAFQAADVAFLLTHPVPVVDAGSGACADGICLAITTIERVGYHGGDQSQPAQPVADYTGKSWDPETCGGPSDTEADCGPGGILTWHNADGDRTVEPGVQVFEDPDPQGSPIGPYPLPAVYVGTCGVILGGGPSAQVPASPATNTAGQLAVETGCG